MLVNLATLRIWTEHEPAHIMLLFFTYSLMGYLLECVWLSLNTRKLVLNRGFTNHLPFCIIYGFGCMLGYTILSPFAGNGIILFLLGAVGASVFEYITAKLQIFMFGDFWWDYNDKPLNYKGILCMESTLGWGVAALLIVKVIHLPLMDVIRRIPISVAMPLAVLLFGAYILDFASSARLAAKKKAEQAQKQEDRPVFAEPDVWGRN